MIWVFRKFKWTVNDIIDIVDNSELLAVMALMGILHAQFWLEPGIPDLTRRINRMSVSRAQRLGASLLRGEGLQSMNLSPELLALLEPGYFPVSLLQAVTEAWQRAVAEATQ
jgi:hypothetical protein